ncbi:MAG: DNA polymerase Y family protein [Candidatus Binatia bacterium]
MDAFFVSVERALNPRLEGRAVIVGGKRGRGVVTSASYEARRYGVHSAMPGFRARELCPQAIFLPTRHEVYREYSSKVFSLLQRYSPIVRKLSIDEGLVDLTGTKRLWGLPLNTAHEIITRLKKELRLPASGGLAGDGMLAKIAAGMAKPHGLVYVPDGSERQFLAPLPVAVIPGVGPKAHAALLHQGIQTVGALLERQDFVRRYLDLETKRKEARDHSMGSETTLAESLSKIEDMEKVLCRLVEGVGERLRAEGLYARCIAIKIRYDDFKTLTRSRTVAVPTCFDREILALARELLRQNVSANKKVRLLGVSASALLARGWQQSLFDFQKRLSWERLYRGIDLLRQKYGDRVIAAGTGWTKGR